MISSRRMVILLGTLILWTSTGSGSLLTFTIDDRLLGYDSKGTVYLKTADFTSIDIAGNCTYVNGAPTMMGATRVNASEGRIELVAYGSEFGHHCGEDQGRFAFKKVKGNFDVIVRIESLTNRGATHFYDARKTPAKAGIMAREGSGPSDRYVAIWAVSNDAFDHFHDAFQFDLRKEAGAWLGNQAVDCRAPHECPEACSFVYGYVNPCIPNPDLFFRSYPNVWIRLKRDGDRFAAMISKDGKDWHLTSQPSHTIKFPDELSVGVALSAAAEGLADQKAEAVFANLDGLP